MCREKEVVSTSEILEGKVRGVGAYLPVVGYSQLMKGIKEVGHSLDTAGYR